MNRTQCGSGSASTGTVSFAFGVTLLLGGLTAAAEHPNTAGDLSSPAREIVSRVGHQPGLVVTLGEGGETLIDALARHGKLLVHGLGSDNEQVQQARGRLQSLGLYGRASIERWQDTARLPYADDLLNGIVCEAGTVSETLVPEMLRVLCPQGVAFVRTPGRDSAVWKRWESALAAAGIAQAEAVPGLEGWLAWEKPRPPEMDDWTHNRFHGPDGNPVSQDRLAGPPAQLRWLADPSWQRVRSSPAASDRSPVFSGGRMFYVNVRATPASLGPTALIARDAHNDLLFSDGASVRLNQRPFDFGDGQRDEPQAEARLRRRGLPSADAARTPMLFARGGGVLDRVWARRSGWTDGRIDGGATSATNGQLLVTAEWATYGVRVFPARREGGFVGYGKELRHTPGKYELFARFYGGEDGQPGDDPAEQRGWTRELPVQVRALLLAGRHLFAAGARDNVDPHQPRLEVFDAATGRALASRRLAAGPVHDGFAAADGRLYLSLQDGTLLCLGEAEPAGTP